MLTKDEILKKLDEMIAEEKDAHVEYTELIKDIHDYLTTQYRGCPTEEIHKIILRLGEIPYDEFKHSLILENLRCKLQ